jgi:seryl-tRNA synthetase
MLDIKLIRENPGLLEENLRKRKDPEKLKLLKEVADKDVEWRKLLKRSEELKHRKNVVSAEIAKTRDKGKIEEMRRISEEIKSIDSRTGQLRQEIDGLMLRIPNLLHESVPQGRDESDNVQVGVWGKKPSFKFKPKDHIDLAVPAGLIDIEHAAKISGARFFFLKGQLALLDMALMHYAWDFMAKQGFTPVWPPLLMRRKPYEGVTDLADFGDVLYKVEGEDLYMIATSEHPLTAQHMDEVLDKLPLLYAGFSTNFRKEAGAHGKDTKGIFRVHQFNKVEQIVICRPEDSWKWHEKLIQNAEKFFQSLGLHYRVMNICTADIGTVAAKKYDLEVWLPGQCNYREAVSCSNCTDYQARRLNIKYREKEGAPPAGFVHTLNSTLVTDRGIVAILENFQREDGSAEIPKVLQPYMGWLKVLGKKN